jgi:Flp pilus assembly protein TadG
MKIRPIRFITKDRKGATAIEFAIIALPFFMLFMGIIEIGLTMFVDSSLNSAIRTVARQGVATGYNNKGEIAPIMQAHMAGTYRDISADSADIKFRMVVIPDVGTIDSGTTTVLKKYTDDPEQIFSAPSVLPSIDSQKGKVVIYAAKYKWNGYTNLMAPILPDNLYAITVVKNEAF